MGESVRLGWVLQSIAIHGTVGGVAGESVADTLVWIGGTTHQQVVKADGAYRFDDWKDSGLLTLGENLHTPCKTGGSELRDLLLSHSMVIVI